MHQAARLGGCANAGNGTRAGDSDDWAQGKMSYLVAAMLPRYHLDLIRDAAEELVYEESANYADSFTCLVIGILLLLLAIAGIRFGADDVARRKLLANSFVGGFFFSCFSVSYLIRSTIIVAREQQSLIIRRHLMGVTWTHRYPVKEIEEVFEALGVRESKKRLLGVELTNGRTKKLTLWAKRTSVSAEAAHLNEALKRARRFGSRQTGRVHKRVTEEARWAHQKENARLDMRRDLRRTLYALVAFIAAAGGVVPFLKGFRLHGYWSGVGTILLLFSMGSWLVLIVEAAFSFIDWQYVRELKKIDNEYGADEP